MKEPLDFTWLEPLIPFMSMTLVIFGVLLSLYGILRWLLGSLDSYFGSVLAGLAFIVGGLFAPRIFALGALPETTAEPPSDLAGNPGTSPPSAPPTPSPTPSPSATDADPSATTDSLTGGLEVLAGLLLAAAAVAALFYLILYISGIWLKRQEARTPPSSKAPVEVIPVPARPLKCEPTFEELVERLPWGARSRLDQINAINMKFQKDRLSPLESSDRDRYLDDSVPELVRSFAALPETLRTKKHRLGEPQANLFAALDKILRAMQEMYDASFDQERHAIAVEREFLTDKIDGQQRDVEAAPTERALPVETFNDSVWNKKP